MYDIRLIDGELLLDDRPAARKHRVDGLQLSPPFLSTLDTYVKKSTQPQLSGRVNGVAFGSTAEALPFAAWREGTLHFNLAGLDLASCAAYLPEGLPGCLGLRSRQLQAQRGRACMVRRQRASAGGSCAWTASRPAWTHCNGRWSPRPCH